MTPNYITRTRLDPAIIDELNEGLSAARRYDGTWRDPGAINQTGLRADSGGGESVPKMPFFVRHSLQDIAMLCIVSYASYI